MTDLSKLAAFKPATKSTKRSQDSRTRSAIEVAIFRPDLSGAQVAEFLRASGDLDAKDAYVSMIVTNARTMWDVLLHCGKIERDGKVYSLTSAPATEVRKSA